MTADIEALTARLSRTLGGTDALLGSPGLWRPMLTLLARGEPVSHEALAAASGHTVEHARARVGAQPDTEYDEAGDIIGYGITLRPTPHRFEVDGRTLHTWCALDTLMFPSVIGRTARVASPCRTTGRPVRVEVEPDRVTGLDPAGAVVSVLSPDECGSVRSSFCDHVHFFASHEAARPWLQDHADATVLNVAEAAVLGRRLAAAMTAGPDCSGPRESSAYESSDDTS